MTSSDFWKKFFLCPKKVAYKICLQFFDLFWRFFACAKFFRVQMDFKKNRTTSCTPSLHALSNGKKKFRKNIVKGIRNFLENESFLAIVRLITFLNKHISGWNFYRRLSALGLTYPENFSPFGRSWTKIDFGGGGGP